MKRLAIAALCGFFVANANALPDGADKELCLDAPLGGRVTLTVEPCKATNNSAFYHAYYTQLDGTQGEGCWIGDHFAVLVIWKDHPPAVYPSGALEKCYSI